ncbi:ATP-binding cassette domain-containing protein [Micromonospora sp. BRA006-A]|nr:ATP-binding cassette domain-containing protein [Micromonospora sp. BRA006-A]
MFNQPKAREDPAGYAELLVKLAQFRPSFREPAQLTRPAGILRLAEGGARAQLVCCCTMSLLSGAHEYARLAAGFRGVRDVWALPNPGFGVGEELPADLDALLRVHADTVLRTVGAGPFVVAGHSGGAMVANLLAGELERQGRPPDAVVLMDTYPADSEVLGGWVPQLLDGMIDRDTAYTPMDDWRTTAWAGYLPLFLDWQPTEMAAATLLVRATEPLGSGAANRTAGGRAGPTRTRPSTRPATTSAWSPTGGRNSPARSSAGWPRGACDRFAPGVPLAPLSAHIHLSDRRSRTEHDDVDEAVVVTELVKRYQPNMPPAVDGLSFSVAAGEVFGLLGPNGAGKTTTIGVLTTRVRATSGRARVCGADVIGSPAAARQLLAVVPQRVNLDRALTVRQNLLFHAAYHRVPRAQRIRRADELLDQMGLKDFANHRTDFLSGGLAQRTMIARALMHSPRCSSSTSRRRASTRSPGSSCTTGSPS